jgi:hypothetical protein
MLISAAENCSLCTRQVTGTASSLFVASPLGVKVRYRTLNRGHTRKYTNKACECEIQWNASRHSVTIAALRLTRGTSDLGGPGNPVASWKEDSATRCIGRGLLGTRTARPTIVRGKQPQSPVTETMGASPLDLNLDILTAECD